MKGGGERLSAVTVELLPCPFCGLSNLVLSERIDGMWRAILCNECGARGPSVKLKEDEIAQDWNARVPAQLQPDPECPDCFTDRECELYFALMLLASHALAWHRDYEQWMQGGLKVEPVVSKALRLNIPALASPDGSAPASQERQSHE